MNTIPAIGRPRILVVDDDASIVTLLSELLSGEGYAVQVAHNGREALAAVARERPALVLCDWMMPAMDGPQLVAELRDRRGMIEGIPIVLMSSTHTASDAPPGVSFLPKPFTLDDVLTLVGVLTGQSILAGLGHSREPWQESREY